MIQQGSGSDLEKRMADLDLDIAEATSVNVLEKEEDEKTVQHNYFREETTIKRIFWTAIKITVSSFYTVLKMFFLFLSNW